MLDEAPFEVRATKSGFHGEPWRGLSADGKFILGRGEEHDEQDRLGLYVNIHDVDTGSLVHHIRLMHPGECASRSDQACDRIMSPRLRKVNAIVSKRLWTQLMGYTPAPKEVTDRQRCDGGDMTQRLRLPTLQLIFRAPRLTVLRADGTPLLERDYPEWMPKKIRTHGLSRFESTLSLGRRRGRQATRDDLVGVSLR